jgi:hypothetical protein
VTDLSPSDFEIVEDGSPQKIGSFTPIFANAPPPAPATRDLNQCHRISATANMGPLVTALVFDRLGPESRRIAVQAAQVPREQNRSPQPSAFSIDLGMAAYAPFTKNVSVLRQALRR